MGVIPYGIIARKTWRRQNFRSLSDKQKLLALYLWTCPAGDGGVGLLYAPAASIAHDLKWTEKETTTVINELEEIGLLKCDHDAGVVLLPRQLDFSPPFAANNVKGLITRIDHLPDTQLLYAYCAILHPYVDAVGLIDWALVASKRYAEWYEIKDAVPAAIERELKAKASRQLNQPAEDEPTDGTNLTVSITNQLRELFHSICKQMPRVMSVTGQRRKHMQARWAEHPDIEWWREYFVRVNRSSFLNGRTLKQRGVRPNWSDFDWIINETNMNKILEGKYDRTNADDGSDSRNNSTSAVHVDTSKYD